MKDSSIISSVQTKRKAEPTNKEQIGASMSGSVLEVLVKGDRVARGQTLMVTEAMKMETSVEARFSGSRACLRNRWGTNQSGDLLIEVKEK